MAAIPFNNSSIDQGGHFTFIGSINDSISIVDNGRSFFSGLYQWEDKKTGEERRVWDISGILEECGFDTYNLPKSKRRQPCIIAAALRSPRVQWLDLGKSNIILDPFAETIAKATISVARQIPTFHGYGGYGDYAKSLQFEEEEKPPSKVEYYLKNVTLL